MLHFSELPKLLLLLLLVVSGSASAAQEAPRWYDVEVILFAQKSQSYRDSEVWPVDYTLPDIENAKELVQLPAGRELPAKPMAFRQLTPDELKLSDDAERIDKASDLDLLAHFGWRQPGLSDDQAVAVKVSIPARQDESKDTAPTEGTLASQPPALPELEGTLKLILSRYLHIDADLLYREPLKAEDVQQVAAEDTPVPTMGEVEDSNQTKLPAQQQDLFMLAEQGGLSEDQPHYRVYRMQQSRRMRSGELHYLDHPVFGLAVMVTPYEPPAKSPATAPAGEQ